MAFDKSCGVWNVFVRKPGHKKSGGQVLNLFVVMLNLIQSLEVYGVVKEMRGRVYTFHKERNE